MYVTTGRERFGLYDIESSQMIRDFAGPRGAVAISPDEKYIVSCGEGVIIWDVEGGLPLITLSDSTDGDFVAVDWSLGESPENSSERSPRNQRIVAGRTDGTVHIWTLPPAAQ